jgi:hypothetical protein
MTRFIASATTAIVFSGAVFAAACASKPVPASSTTTRTQTSTERATGETTRSDVKETRTEKPDGTQVVQTTTTTKDTTPPPSAPAPQAPPVK